MIEARLTLEKAIANNWCMESKIKMELLGNDDSVSAYKSTNLKYSLLLVRYQIPNFIVTLQNINILIS